MTGRGGIKVCVYPADQFGCGHFRMIHPARVLRDQGHDVSVITPGRRDGFTADVGRDGEVLRVRGIPAGTDVVVMQRVSQGMLSRAIPAIRRAGIAVVIDMDDDLSTIHPDNPAFMGLHPRAGHEFSWRNAADACRAATMVTATTRALLDRYGPPGGLARRLDNYVPASYLTIPHTDVPGDIAYAGSMHSHPDDVPMMRGAIRSMVDEGRTFRVVGGESAGFRDALGLSDDPPASGGLHIDEWPRHVAAIGVGVAPLADSAFNRAKSRLKVLEMSALGVPWVASPSAEYERFSHMNGVGILARRERDWVRALRRLTSDADLRAEISAKSREAVADQTYELNAWRWMNAWTEAVDHQRSTM